MSVNNTNCCVFGCHTKKGKDIHLSFHAFPDKRKTFVYMTNKLGVREKVDKYKAWMIKLNMGKPATKALKVCSRHFTSDDFILPGIRSNKPRLKANAVPSQNLPQRSFDTHGHQSTTRRNKQKHARTQFETGNKKNTGLSVTGQEGEQSAVENLPTLQHSTVFDNISVTEHEAISGLLDLKYSVFKKDQATQVLSGDIVVSFITTVKTDKELNTLTGLPSFTLLDVIVTQCENIFGSFTNKNKLTLRECIFLTFMKLKNGLTYSLLAVLFKSITAATCRNIFHETLIMLSKVLAPLIYWPSTEEIKLNMPVCFQGFQKARVVIDCTEIPVQRAKCLATRLKTYSHYKKGHTIKYMTAVTPGGLIAFVSKGYGGRCSDKAIFQQSGLVEKLDMFRDEIMVDKGFLIQDITDEHFVKVIQPPFLKKQNQFSKAHALLNQKIAKARVHVERVNQRIKIFEIFKKPLPVTLWPRVDDIFVIICAIVNLTNSVLDDCRFIQNE